MIEGSISIVRQINFELLLYLKAYRVSLYDVNIVSSFHSLRTFAKTDKSNVAVARLFFKLSMDPLVGNDCPISIFSGLGGHGLSFSGFGQ